MGRRRNSVERFWSHVRKTDSCWLWMGALGPSGYGKTSYAHRDVRAHRFIYERAVGPIPHGMNVLHACDVRNCVNPAHLFLGTNADNSHDMVRKQRQNQGERHYRAKFTRGVVRQIRQEHQGGETMAALARKHNVSETAIAWIVKRRTWRSVA